MAVERHTIGDFKVSIVLMRKTTGDLLVAQFTMERWFTEEPAAIEALDEVTRVFIESEEDRAIRRAIRGNGE